MKLSPPTKTVFWISLIIAIVAVLSTLVAIPMITPQIAFWLLALAFLLLALGNALKGF